MLIGLTTRSYGGNDVSTYGAGLRNQTDQRRLGHEFGDQALAATARILRATFRASDVIARLGGDEFIVLAIATGPSFECRISKRLLQACSELNGLSGAVPVSFSVGFAHYIPGTSQETTIEQLMTETDQAMYAE